MDTNCTKDTVFVEMPDGQKVALHTWVPDGEVKAVVQLSHGMAEYAKRYDRMGEIFAANGIAFYAHDHRGHGETAGTPENFGYLADKNGFNRVVEDVHEMVQKCHTDFPGKKVFLFGHSFGSFVAQNFIENYAIEISGCILCGSAGPRGALTGTAHVIASIVSLFGGAHGRSKFINNLAFGSYNSRFAGEKGTAWLSRDPAQVAKYDADEACGFVCTNEFFKDFFGGLTATQRPAMIKRIPATLPVFIIAGEEDPVGDYGKTVRQLHDIYRANGLRDLEMKLYPGARHELLNETNHEEVEADILNWVKGRLA